MNIDTWIDRDTIDMRHIPQELLGLIPGKYDSREDFRPRVEYNLTQVIEAYRTCMNNPGMRQSKEDEIMELLQRIPHDVLLLPKVQASITTFNALLLASLDALR